MQTKQQLLNNGQELQTGDVNAIAAVAAKADDVVFSELLHPPIYGSTAPGVTSNIFRGVIPMFSRSVTTLASSGIVHPIAASAGVVIYPFTAVVGMRTSGGAWRDIRSVVYDPGGTFTAVTPGAGFGANSSGNPRWDLLYATVMVDANAAGVNRYVKDPATKVVSQVNTVTQVSSTLSFSIQAGTAAGSPQFPATPADPAGGYNIPIAYVRIPNGFNASSTIANTDICECSVPIALPGTPHPATLNTTGCLTSGAVGTWGSSGNRPVSMIPPTMSAGHAQRIIALDLLDPSSANWNISGTTNAPIDQTIDWSNRIIKITAVANYDAGAAQFAWESGANYTKAVPSTPAVAPAYVHMGTSVLGNIVIYQAAQLPAIQGGASITLSVNFATGALQVTVTGAPLVKMVLWIEASGQFPNIS